VDTVSARNFAGDNECHGWIGLRFQTEPLGPPSDVILHVNLRDNSNLAQQAAVGILGVNLIYSSVHYLSDPAEFLKQIFADLSLKRMEIDCVELNGPAFEKWNPRAIHVSLVANNFAEAVIFSEDGQLAPASEVLYKKAVVLEPKRFNLSEPAQQQMIAATLASLPKEELAQSKGSIGFYSLSCAPDVPDQGTLSEAQMLEHIDALQKLGSGVFLFRERELYKMAVFVNRFTKAQIHFAARLTDMIRALRENYKDLEGALLEGLARLFRENVRLCVFPITVAAMKELEASTPGSGWKWKEVNGVIGANDVEPPEPLNHLFRYLIGSGFILPKGNVVAGGAAGGGGRD
jgi:hypothetical protein